MNVLKFKKGILLLFVSLSISFSCNDYFIESKQSKNNVFSLSQEESMERFASVLSQALDNKDIRDFIKKEALKKVDKDFDVIYYYVKDFKMENGLTFHENIKKYSNDPDVFDEIIKNNKLLTVFVPSLGDNFSASRWNVDSQIPCVTVRDNCKNPRLKVFGKSDCEYVDKDLKPDFPVLVVKTNERLAEIGNLQTRSLSTIGISNKDGVFAHFLDESFDNLKPSTMSTKAGSGYNGYVELPYENIEPWSKDADKRLNQAAFFYSKECPRDYLYYRIGKGADKGTLKTDMREYITSIQFNSPGGINFVEDDWTDGDLEMNYDFIFVNRNGGALNITKMQTVELSRLCDVAFSPTQTYTYNLPEPIEIFNWDLYTYGNMYKISVSEYDPGNVIERNVSSSSIYGNNFETEGGASFLEIFKVGMKYSTSQTITNQSSVKTQMTNNTDLLGDIIVNFFDPLYLNNRIDIRVDGSGYPASYDNAIESKYFSFSSSADCWSYIEKLYGGEDAYCKYPFINVMDETKYQGTYISNTGMIKLTVQPRYYYN